MAPDKMDTTSQPEGTFRITVQSPSFAEERNGRCQEQKCFVSKVTEQERNSSDWKIVFIQTGTLLRVKEVLTGTIGINQDCKCKAGSDHRATLSLREASEP